MVLLISFLAFYSCLNECMLSVSCLCTDQKGHLTSYSMCDKCHKEDMSVDTVYRGGAHVY